MIWIRHLPAIGILIAVSHPVRADTYHPGFACSSSDTRDQLISAICSSSEMAKAELSLERVYYVYREIEGPTAVAELRRNLGKIDIQTRSRCNIPGPESTVPIPSNTPECYVKETERLASLWGSSIYGLPYAEANRDIDTHLALQNKLIAFGLLKEDAADGVYGDATRDAIITWQRSQTLEATGFLSNLEARELLASSESPPLTSPERPIAVLQRIFTRDMLLIRGAYLESLVGPARRVSPLGQGREVRVYRVVGCNVSAYVDKDGDVEGYGVDVNRACKPDISDIFSRGESISWPSTFGIFSQNMPGAIFQSDCLYSCGNVGGRVALLRYRGPHVENFVNVQLQVQIDGGRPGEAARQWSSAMRARGDTYLLATQFNCDGAFQSAAATAFAGIQFTHLYVGYGQDETADFIDNSCRGLK